NSKGKLFGQKDLFFSKLSNSGKLIGAIIFGGNASDKITNMCATPDGGAIIVIYSSSNSSDIEYNNNYQNNKVVNNPDRNLISATEAFIEKNPEGFGKGDCQILKFDKDANMEWQKTYGSENDELP